MSEGIHERRPHARARRTIALVRSTVQPRSFPFLLAALVLLYLINGLALESMAGLSLAGRFAVLGAGVYVLSGHRLTLWIGLVIGAIGLTLEMGWWGLPLDVASTLEDSIASGFFIWILIVVLREVFDPNTSAFDAVVGAICGFMLVILVFMRIHGLLEASWPGSYQLGGAPLAHQSETATVALLQYFSTVTVTTVGFGDVVPVSPAARVTTGAEAILGQLYLAVVIATLVARVSSQPLES